MSDTVEPAVVQRNACANCRRPIMYLAGVEAWVHGELLQYAHEEATCARPRPVDWICASCGTTQASTNTGQIGGHTTSTGRCPGSFRQGDPPIGADR